MTKVAWAKIALALTVAPLIASTAHAQIDAALSVYGSFGQSVSGNNTQQNPANQAGGLVELRRIKNPLVGYEATYAYNRNNQRFTNISSVCPVNDSSCSISAAAISANAHEVTGDWIISLRGPTLRPFALAGGGVLLNMPTAGTVTTTTCGTVNPLCSQSTTAASTSTSTKGVFVYGAGIDWTLLPHLGLRFQYRGNVYKAADLTSSFSSTNAFARNSQPMIGVFFRL
jgi:opacity protein-like surface antigen